MQAESLVHEMAFKLVTPEGTVCGVHVVPPSVVARMAAPGSRSRQTSRDTDIVDSMQEIPLKFVMVAGNVSVVHNPPPFVVAMMLGELPVKSLTARHVDAY